jgi:hypothetical protein
MNAAHLNEHDANQGAQSTGEFLGMSGNSGWYLFASAGVSVFAVIVLWGVLGVSLLLCLLIGLLLCGLSLAYVFGLKNNRPAHYDTDFFEATLVESGLLRFRFEPRSRKPLNPFLDTPSDLSDAPTAALEDPLRHKGTRPARRHYAAAGGAAFTVVRSEAEKSETATAKVISLEDHQTAVQQLEETCHELEEELVGKEEV